jgi:hypothetical protein
VVVEFFKLMASSFLFDVKVIIKSFTKKQITIKVKLIFIQKQLKFSQPFVYGGLTKNKSFTNIRSETFVIKFILDKIT